LFLRPQHLQQQERYLERYVEGRCHALRPHGWGFSELEIERDLLAIGKLALRRAVGVFPDGTPFAMPDIDPLPPPLELTTQVRDQGVMLATALRRDGARQTDRREQTDGVVRYRTRDYEVRDVTADSNTTFNVEIATLRTKLVPASEPLEDFACIPAAHVLECRADRQVVLEERFMPTVQNVHQAPRLATFLTELQGLLHQRGEALAAFVVPSDRGGAGEIGNFLMLQTVNRYEPVVTHLVQSRLVHPDDFYRLCVELAGDLATLTSATRRPVKLPAYRHDDLRASFEPVIAALRRALSVEVERNAIQIPLEKRRYGIHVGTVNDRTLFDTAAFVLTARADVPAEALRKALPAQVTIATVESIAKLVNEHLSGVPLEALSVAPRQIPYHAGTTYFEMDRSNARFKELKSGGGIAIHVPETFPGLGMELWAIRG
jgi:type VI secretion system protein ImpJ